MVAVEEYRIYVETGNKAIFESVVTLENSENNYQEYFKRLLLRRIYAATDFTEREAEVLLRQWGIMVAPQSIEEIGREFGVTRERIRQISAKALHKIQYPDRNNRNFLQVYTTHEEFAKVLELLRAEDGMMAEMVAELAHVHSAAE
jgi:DNA-directed RNA polymerase sigma subunit (sigma70/sigma32)